MNMKHGITTVLIVAFLSGLYCMPAFAKHPKGTKSKPVKLKVKDPDGANPTLSILTSGISNGCGGGSAKNGCVGVEKAYAADLLFELSGSTKCAEGYDWEFTGLQLAGYDSDSKPADADWGKRIPADAAADFSANEANGEVPFVSIDEDTIRAHNKNQSKYEIWYRLKATCNGKDIYSDPQVRNSGK